MDAKIYRVIDIINLSTDHLKSRGFENARLNAELITAYVMKMNRVQLYLNFEKPLTDDELGKVRQLLKRRTQHEPIQYLTGVTEFFSLKFYVSRNTLIPRPETELLVETVIKKCAEFHNQNEVIQILDIGTGSGNIAVALSKNIENSNITAIDIHADPLHVARQNADYHQVLHKIEFLEGDIFQPLFESAKAFHVIVSNPPYISEQEYENLPAEVKDYEPAIALKADKEGTQFYHRIAELAQHILRDDGFVAIEIGANQAESVQQIFETKTHFQSIEIIRDLNNLPRIVLAK